ncbi:hypothetical protein [Streptomyces sp. NPDC014734]
MRGSSATLTHDLGDNTHPDAKPADPGRKGGREDISRGDEKNR